MRTAPSRFASNALSLVAGLLIVVAVFAFRVPALAWIAFGLATVVVVGVLAAFATPARGGPARAVDVLLVLVGIWAILASRVFGGQTNRWLDFACGVAVAVLGGLGLIVHEVLLARELSARSLAGRFGRAPGAGVQDARRRHLHAGGGAPR